MLAKLFFLLSLLTGCLTTQAQKHDAISLMGYSTMNRGFADFKFSPPFMAKTSIKVDFLVSAVSYCDSLGNLLFYSNGISVQTKDHVMMTNGDSINAISHFWESHKQDGYPVVMPMFVVPSLAQKDHYYMIHQAVRFGPSEIEFPLLYSEIDMAQQGGKGKVVLKNKFLIDGAAISSAMVKHGNGRDWWLVSALSADPKQQVFLISEKGLTGPYTKGYGPFFEDDKEAIGHSLFSPDGRTYVRVEEREGLRIYDFDRCSGEFSNLRLVPYGKGFRAFGAAFSADSRFLYINFTDFIAVLDLFADDLSSTLDTVAYYDGFADKRPFDTGFWVSQLHEDGKIYYATTNGTRYWHVMHHPELPGLAANLQQHYVRLPVINNGTMCRFPNYRLGRLKGSPCDTLPLVGAAEDHFMHTLYGAGRQGSVDTLNYRVFTPLRGKGIPAGPDVPDAVLWPLLNPDLWRKQE